MLLAPLQAARLLSERYFGGAAWLGRSEEERVSELLRGHRQVMGRAIRVLEAMDRRDGEDAAAAGLTDDVVPSSAAVRLAEELVIKARLEVSQMFDDDDRGFELAKRLIGTN